MVLKDPSLPIDDSKFTTSEWVASALRRLAEHLHASTVPQTPEQIAADDLREAEMQLLTAFKELERWSSTADMLRTRIERLHGGSRL